MTPTRPGPERLVLLHSRQQIHDRVEALARRLRADYADLRQRRPNGAGPRHREAAGDPHLLVNTTPASGIRLARR